jgi:hypothetical protein
MRVAWQSWVKKERKSWAFGVCDWDVDVQWYGIGPEINVMMRYIGMSHCT